MHKKRILITGITGFIGSHLATYLNYHYPTCKIIGIGRGEPRAPRTCDFYSVNLLQPESVFEVIDNTRPDYVFHLAGLVFSFDWKELYDNNVVATRYLLDAIKKAQVNTRVIVAGSAAEYGIVDVEKLPIHETYPAAPQSPYAMTKLWQTLIAQYYSTLDVPVIIARIFNVIGSGVAPQLSIGNLLSQLKKISHSETNEANLCVGDLHIKRDFLDIIDVCSAVVALAKRGHVGEIYNICSGVSVAYSDIIRLASKLSKKSIHVIADKNIKQNTTVRDSRGCNAKIIQDVDWMPCVTLEDSIRKMLRISEMFECV